MEERAPTDEQIEIQTKEGKGDRESPKGKYTMPEWLEKQLEKKTPAPKDPRARLEAILS